MKYTVLRRRSPYNYTQRRLYSRKCVIKRLIQRGDCGLRNRVNFIRASSRFKSSILQLVGSVFLDTRVMSVTPCKYQTASCCLTVLSLNNALILGFTDTRRPYFSYRFLIVIVSFAKNSLEI